MVASLMTLVGLPNAFAKSKPAQPSPRFAGLCTAVPYFTGAGMPTDTAT